MTPPAWWTWLDTSWILPSWNRAASARSAESEPSACWRSSRKFAMARGNPKISICSKIWPIRSRTPACVVWVKPLPTRCSPPCATSARSMKSIFTTGSAGRENAVTCASTRLSDVCNGCMVCAKNCPVDAISGEKKKQHVIDQDACIRCGVCRDVCKYDSVVVK